MNKRALSVCMLLMSVFMISGIAYAKVWLLPDYQERFYDRPVPPTPTPTLTCSSYGGIARASLGNGQVCSGAFSLSNGTACCSSYTCSSEYKYNLNNCPTSKNLILSGSTCVDASGTTWYTQCGCGSDYPATTDTCELGVDTTSGCCTFDGKTYCKSCNNDPCSDEDNVVSCAEECCSHVCGSNTCLKDKCSPTCGPNKGCPTLYATSLEGCESYGLTLINNSELMLGTETNGSVNGAACRICTIDCKSGYADYNQFWCKKTPETACETLGYLQPTLKCGTGYKELFCPFDTNYSVCVKTGTTNTPTLEDLCGSDELIGESVAHAYGKTSTSIATMCHKAVCKITKTTTSFTSTLGTVYNLNAGGYVIASCATGYNGNTDSNGCITSCDKPSDICDVCLSGATCETKASGAKYMTECPEGWNQSGTATGLYGTCVTCNCQMMSSAIACENCGGSQYAYEINGCYYCTDNGFTAAKWVPCYNNKGGDFTDDNLIYKEL